MPFIAAAAVDALRRFPIVNASLESRQAVSIHYHQNINLGIAVALEWGLIVPVVRQAEGTQLCSAGPRHRRSRRPRPLQETHARRSRRVHLHPHQLRRLRRRIRHPHHQSARVGHPRHRRPAQGAGRAHRRRGQRHHRHPLHAVLHASASITASSTAPTPANSCSS